MDYSHLLDLIDNNTEKELKIEYIKEEKCCDNSEIFKNTCLNCGMILNETIFEEQNDENDVIVEYKDLNYINLVGKSKLPSIRRMYMWSRVSYNTRTLTIEILPLIKKMYNQYNIHNNRIITKTYIIYKEYFNDKDNIRRRDKIKKLLILFFMYITCNIYNIDLDYINILIDNKFNTQSLKYFKKSDTIEEVMNYTVDGFINDMITIIINNNIDKKISEFKKKKKHIENYDEDE